MLRLWLHIHDLQHPKAYITVCALPTICTTYVAHNSTGCTPSQQPHAGRLTPLGELGPRGALNRKRLEEALLLYNTWQMVGSSTDPYLISNFNMLLPIDVQLDMVRAFPVI